MQQSQIAAPENSQQPQADPVAQHLQSSMLKINADNQDPKRGCLKRTIIIIIIICIFCVVFALPTQFRVLNNQIAFRGENSTKGCNPTYFDANNKLQCSNLSASNPVLGLMMPDLVDSNQFALIYFRLIKNVNNTNTTKVNQTLQVQLYELTPLKNDNNQKQFLMNEKIYNGTAQFSLNKQNYQGSEASSGPNGEKRFIFRFLFAYSRFVVRNGRDQTDYVLFVKFTNYPQISSGIDEMAFEALVIQVAFTNFTIIMRGVYCLISLITMIIFLRRYFQLAPQDRIMQIRFVAIGSVLLFLFNDPFYAITVLKPNPGSVFFSCLFVVDFLLFLQIFWVFFLRRIYYEHDEKNTELFQIKRSWPFYLIFLIIYILSLILFLQVTYFSLQNIPIILGNYLQRMKVIPTIILLALVMSGVAIYQIVIYGLLLRKYCCNRQNQMLWRHRNYLRNYPMYFIGFIIFFSVGASMPYSYEGVWILYGYSFMNLFIFIMQYLYYTPAQQLQKKREQIEKPAQKFSISSDFQLGNKNQKRQQQSIQGKTNLQQE